MSTKASGELQSVKNDILLVKNYVEKADKEFRFGGFTGSIETIEAEGSGYYKHLKKGKVLELIEKFIEDTSMDHYFFYYSGHGKTTKFIE